MSIKALVFISLLVGGFVTNASDQSDVDSCREQVNSGNWSNRFLATMCTLRYDFPSPYTIKCLRRELNNYINEPDTVTECHYHFRDDKNDIYRNFRNYDINKDLPKELLLPYQILKRAYTTELD